MNCNAVELQILKTTQSCAFTNLELLSKVCLDTKTTEEIEVFVKIIESQALAYQCMKRLTEMFEARGFGNDKKGE